MTTATFERYGLTSNPFRDLASESLSDIEVFHVNLPLDDTLRTIKEEVFENENRAFVAITGGHGAGKTERLLLAATEARQRKAFVVYYDITAKTSWILKGVASEFLATAKRGGLATTFSSPKWFRAVTALQSIKDQGYDAIQAGKTLAAALNESTPAFLLLNDLHHLTQPAEVDAFSRTLQEVADSIRPGVLVMFGCYPSYLEAITRTRPALASRINRTFPLPTLGNDEAALLLAKKLLAKRIVEDLDPIYPFDRESIGLLNAHAAGNPRRLLEAADLAIAYAVEHRSYRVDAEVARAALDASPKAAVSPSPTPSAPPTARSAGVGGALGSAVAKRLPQAGGIAGHDGQ
jgi:type II secretory pathway predicted ATPase ExeA